jgi:hypothetical protein
MVVTGSRIRRAAPSDQSKSGRFGAFAAPRAEDEAVEVSADDRAFLSRLQTAVRSGDRRSILRLIAFPLRVNGLSGVRFYRDEKSVERDFDQIFTPKVTRAILDQRPDRLFTRDQGVMIGDGEVWFSASCTDTECSTTGPVRITSINP